MANVFENLSSSMNRISGDISYGMRDVRKLKEINEKILNTALEQTAEVQKLNSQISVGNEIQKQMLQNQINEIKEKKKQNYLKDLIFYFQKLHSKHEEIKDDIVRYRIINTVSPYIESYLDMAIEDLNELGDKEKASQLNENFQKQLKSTENLEEKYQSSDFTKVDALEKEYYSEQEKLKNLNFIKPEKSKESEKKKSKILTVWKGSFFSFLLFIILGVILFSNKYQDIGGFFVVLSLLSFVLFVILSIIYLFSYQKNKKVEKKIYNETLKNLESDFENQKNNALAVVNNHQYLQELEKLKQNYKEFFEYKEFIKKHFAKFNEKWALDMQIGI